MTNMTRLTLVLPLLLPGCLADSDAIGELVDTGQADTSDTDQTDADATDTTDVNETGEDPPGATSVGTGGPDQSDSGTDGGTDGGTDPGETETTGIGDDVVDPEACLAPDDVETGAGLLNIGDWIEGPILKNETLNGTCTVTDVSTTGDYLRTELSCMTETTGPHAVSIDVAVPVSGTVTWAVDDAVTLTGWVNNSKGGHLAAGGASFMRYWVSLNRQTDGALLLGAATAGATEIFAPLDVVEHPDCAESGCGSDINEAAMQFSVSEPGGDSVVVTGGHHADLALLDGTRLSIDPLRAHLVSNDCHFASVSIAVRRVTP